MTPKEKAKEIFDRFYLNGIKKYSMQYENSVQCALICVDEILRILPFTYVKYWQEVKQEIKKL